jgi:hypothetical protein
VWFRRNGDSAPQIVKYHNDKLNATTIPGTPPDTDGGIRPSNAQVRQSSGASNLLCVGVTRMILPGSAVSYWCNQCILVCYGVAMSVLACLRVRIITWLHLV